MLRKIATDQDGGQQEDRALGRLAILDGGQGQDHGHRRADQDERIDGRQIDGQRVGQLVVGQGPFVGLERLVFGVGARPT